MAFLDTSEHKSDDFKPFPVGQYLLEVKKAEWKETSTGGHMLATELVVAKGAEKGRLVWHNFNLDNNSKAAVEIAQKQLTRVVLAATGKDVKLASPKEAIKIITGALVKAQVKISEATDKYPAKNEIHYFLDETTAAEGKKGKKGKKKKKKKSAPWD